MRRTSALVILGAALSWVIPVVTSHPLGSTLGSTTGSKAFFAVLVGADVLGVLCCLWLPIRRDDVRWFLDIVCGLCTVPWVIFVLLFYGCAVYGDCL